MPLNLNTSGLVRRKSSLASNMIENFRTCELPYVGSRFNQKCSFYSSNGWSISLYTPHASLTDIIVLIMWNPLVLFSFAVALKSIDLPQRLKIALNCWCSNNFVGVTSCRFDWLIHNFDLSLLVRFIVAKQEQPSEEDWSRSKQDRALVLQILPADRVDNNPDRRDCPTEKRA